MEWAGCRLTLDKPFAVQTDAVLAVLILRERKALGEVINRLRAVLFYLLCPFEGEEVLIEKRGLLALSMVSPLTERP